MVSHRKTTAEALERLGSQVDRMEVFGARPDGATQASLKDLEESELFVGIYAHRYGYVPTGSTISITEQEYDHARKLAKPMFCFIVKEDFPWPPLMIENDDPAKSKLRAFKARIKTNSVIDVFTTPEDLASKVVAAVGRYITHSDRMVKIQGTGEDNNTSNILAAAKITTKRTVSFTGEKSIFVGRHDYIDNKLKQSLITPGSYVSIVGPGGSGKSQLAFKAIHQYYEKEAVFDLVLPIYFDTGIIAFDQFLSKIAIKLPSSSIEINEFEKKGIDERKDVIRNILNKKTHPLIFADNFETISYPINIAKLNDQAQSLLDDCVKIKYFLNNEIPENTSVLITSRERINLGGREKIIDLEGLNEDECKELFSTLVVEQYLKNPTSDRIKQQIDNLLQKMGGHPLSIEIMAKNVTTVEEVEEISKSLGDKVNIDEPNKRLQSLKASFDYTIHKLDNNLKDLLQKLTFFKSPFPLHAAEEIFDAKRKDLINLYNRSLLLRIESHDVYGKIQDPEYLLYKFHPVTRDYLENEINQKIREKRFYEDLQENYGKRFSIFYYDLLDDIFDTLEIKKGVDLTDEIIRFNTMFEENNDFERALTLTNKPSIIAEGFRLLGSILNRLGIYNKALEYHRKSEQINNTLNDNDSKIRLVRDHQNIGWIFSNLRNFDQALYYHNKALEEYQQLNNGSGIARQYSYIGLTLSKLKKHQEGLEYHKKAIAIDTKINNNDRWLAEDYQNIASTLYSISNYNETLEYYKLALKTYIELGDTRRQAYCYSGLGLTYQALGEHQQALDHHSKALERQERLKDDVGIAREYYNISFVFSARYKKKKALEYLSLSKSILEEFERHTGYHHPILDQVQEKISYLQNIK